MKSSNKRRYSGNSVCFVIDEIPPSLNKFRYFNSLKKSYIKRNKLNASICFDKPVEVIIKIYTSNKRLDIDNTIKCILDLLQESKVIKNDNLVYKLTVEKIISDKEKVEIRVKSI